MADANYRIGVASSDGIVVNTHFGKARDFFIYEVATDGSYELVEKRELEPICESADHDEDRLSENLEKLSDCRFLLVARIGNRALYSAQSRGIYAFDVPGPIDESIVKLIRYKNAEDLFK